MHPPVCPQPPIIGPFRPVEDPQPGPLPLYLAWPQGICPTLLQVMHHLLLSQAKTAQALWVAEATPVPERPWNLISIDFIEQLPPPSGYTSILVVVDRLSKQGIFITTHNTIMSSNLTWLFVIHVFSKHGVPAHVTCDRGSEFVSHFFRSLGMALDMKLHFTSGYHPEGDGQTERTNQTLE